MTAPLTPQPLGFTTAIVHSDRQGGVEHNGVHKPVHTSVQYGYDRVEDLIAMFQGRLKGFAYARQNTPTVAALETKITQMEQGLGTVCFATGMAAISAVFFMLLRSGDHIVASRYVFGNTNSLLGSLVDFSVDVSKVDVTAVASVAAALRPNTRMVFVETIANPGTQVPDLDAIGALCRERGILFVVDNTVTSPWLFRPASVGAGLIINSLTKSIAGHGNALGGAVTDTGLFDWSAYPNVFENYRTGDPRQWGLTQIRKKGLRDMGGALSSQHAHLISVGAETLALRCAHTSASALAVAQFLQSHPAIARVRYPFLADHPQHALAVKHFKSGSWLLSFELKNADDCLPFINRLQVPIKATGLGDTRSLVIPVASTIFWEAGPAVRAQMEIGDGMVRYSVGLEDPADLIADLAQALG